MNKFQSITTDQIKNFIKDTSIHILDVRSSDAYNGWNLQNEKRGGHIRSAKSFPLEWLKYSNWMDILKSKEILPEHKIVIYSYCLNDSNKMAEELHKIGYKNILIYNHFLDEWSNNTEFPMENLPRYKHLVPPQWLNSLINNEYLTEYNNDKYVIVHAHYRNRDAYLSGHIPGAIDMDTLALEAPETWNRRSPSELKKALEKHGITADTTVILYGKYLKPDNADKFPGSAAGHIGAIRLAMIMMYAGVKDVRVLNGGFQSWVEKKYPVDYDDIQKKPVENFGVNIPAYPEIIVDMDEAKEMIQSNDAELVSVRSWAEYIGEVSGYNYIDIKGRIPGSVFGNCGTDAYHMENYRNIDHTVREAQEVIKIWNDAGITPDKHIAFYCGTGWRGSEAWFNAWLMGWPRVSVYDGGWFEWSNNPENPIETGEPKKKPQWTGIYL